jgi:hypothetical protein
MFVLCEGMKWSHLPVAGGIYDQHPDLIDGFRIIFSIRNQHEAEEAEKRERNMGANQRRNDKGASRPAVRRRR